MGSTTCKHKELQCMEKCSEYTTADHILCHVLYCACTRCSSTFLINCVMYCPDSTKPSSCDSFIDPTRCMHHYFTVDKTSIDCVRCSPHSPFAVLLNLSAGRNVVPEYKMVACAICNRCLSEVPVEAIDVDETQMDETGCPLITWRVKESALPKKVKPDTPLTRHTLLKR